MAFRTFTEDERRIVPFIISGLITEESNGKKKKSVGFICET